MKTKIAEFFREGAVLSTASGIEFGVAKLHLETLANILPQIADGSLEPTEVYEAEYVDGRVNQLAVMFGGQEVLKGEAKAYLAGNLPSFENADTTEEVYVVVIDGSHISFTVREDGAANLYNGGILNSFVVPAEDFAEFPSLIEGVDFASYPSQSDAE